MASVDGVVVIGIYDFAASLLLSQDDGFSHTGICAGGKHMGDTKSKSSLLVPKGHGRRP